jgi:hypothetical protein
MRISGVAALEFDDALEDVQLAYIRDGGQFNKAAAHTL